MPYKPSRKFQRKILQGQRETQEYVDRLAEISKTKPGFQEWMDQTGVDRPFVVYKVSNADGELIYVGVSRDVLSRLRTHYHSSVWAGQAARIDFEEFARPHKASDREQFLIQQHQPPYNLGKKPYWYRG